MNIPSNWPKASRFCQKTVEESQKDPERKEVLRPLKMSNKRGSKAGTSLAMNEGFIVKHYAGFVEYNTKGWLDKTLLLKSFKNNDRLGECEELICESSFELVKKMGQADAGQPGQVHFQSMSKKYCQDLENLLETLNTCHLHYIRCFKPNECQKPASFHETLVMDQLVQCGAIELVKIMHDGFPNRCHFDEIVKRFRDLLPDSFQRYGMRTFIEALMLAYDVPAQEWALGMSRLFLKAGQLKALEDIRSEGAEADPERLQQILHNIIRKKRALATRALATRALLVGRLQLMLLAAREKIRLRALRRRFRVAAWAAIFLANGVIAKRQRLCGVEETAPHVEVVDIFGREALELPAFDDLEQEYQAAGARAAHRFAVFVAWQLQGTRLLDFTWQVRVRTTTPDAEWQKVDLDSGVIESSEVTNLSWKHRACFVQKGLKVLSFCVEEGRKSQRPIPGTVVSHYPGLVTVDFELMGGHILRQHVPQDRVLLAATSRSRMWHGAFWRFGAGRGGRRLWRVAKNKVYEWIIRTHRQ
eukprot:symbB.v1.2.030630.t1/scaffold3475.1/size55991/2